MCGITGIVKLKKGDFHFPTVIQKMTDTLRHRGPDGEGFLFIDKQQTYTAYGKDTPLSIQHSSIIYKPLLPISAISDNCEIAFGHRRLSIIDLSEAGHQPMCNPQQNLWITYNGEIYNYLELRAELKTLGHIFETATDTEVILHAYREWGNECVSKFNGMWAFVIYDKEKNTLFGSRDRFGVKPFYYVLNEHIFAFASEQKSFLKAGLIKPKLNPEAVFDFFVFSKIEGHEEGMFAGIFELQQAHSFEFNLGEQKLKKWKYYTLPHNEEFKKFDPREFENLSQKTREYIIESIKLRLRSDVAVGSCLSGGIDSSGIVAIMNLLLKNENKKINLFTASFTDDKIDEGKWAKLMVDSTHSEWSRTFPTAEELKNDLENLMYCQDIPIWSTSTYAQYRVMQLAKEKGVKVILDGQGGDELWGGYPHHQSIYLRELLVNANFKSALSLLKNSEIKGANSIWFAKQYMKHSGISSLPKLLQPVLFKNYFQHLNYLNPDFFNQYKQRFESHFEGAPKNLNAILYKESTSSLLKGYLKCEDRCSMWHSVESRTPYADDINLVELAFNTPSVYKIYNNQSKYILRKALKDLVPESILNRKDKMGYTTPNNQWINGIKASVKEDFHAGLSDIFNLPELHSNYDKLFGDADSSDNGQTFKFISFAIWHKIFEL